MRKVTNEKLFQWEVQGCFHFAVFKFHSVCPTTRFISKKIAYFCTNFSLTIWLLKRRPIKSTSCVNLFTPSKYEKYHRIGKKDQRINGKQRKFFTFARSEGSLNTHMKFIITTELMQH